MDPNSSNPNNGGVQPSQNPVASASNATPPTPHVVIPPPQPVIDQSAAAYTASPSVSEVTDGNGPKKSHIKLFAAVAVLVILAVSLPLTIFLTQQQQTIKSGAANTITDATVVGSFNGSQFTVGTLKDVILEQYGSDSLYNSDTLKIARDIYVERRILDTKSAELGLSISQTDIDSLAVNTGLTPTQAKYELLKQQIILTQVNYVKAVSIGFWVPPGGEIDNYATEVQQIVQKQKDEGAGAIAQASASFNNGQDVLTIAQSIYANPAYSDLKPVLSMNASKFAQIPDSDKQTAAQPVLYEYGDTNFDSKTRDLLFGIAKGEVATSISDQSSGGEAVFKVIEKGSGTFNSYKDWLNKQESDVYNPVSF